MTSSSTPADDADDEEFSLSSRLSRPFGDVGFSINWQSVGANAWWHGYACTLPYACSQLIGWAVHRKFFD